MPADQSLVALFTRRAEIDAAREAVWFRRKGQPQIRTFAPLRADVRRSAAALETLGVQPGDRIAQLAENRYEWLLLDLAAGYLQAVHVAIHATLAAEQIVEQVLDSGARLLIVSTNKQIAKLAKVADRLPRDLKVLSYEGGAELAERTVGSFADVFDEADERAGARLEQTALASLTPDSLATILYTSGTTGEPKGVMLTHGNLTSNALASAAAFGDDAIGRRLCWLPLSHIFARTCDLYVWLAAGGTLGLAESRDTILRDCAEFCPQMMNGVPYFFDKVCRHLTESGTADQPGRLTKLLGGSLRACCSGGAPLSNHVAELFNHQGVVLVQGYGLTETSPVIATGSRAANRIGTVGPPIPGVEVQIAADGEILTRGPHVMRGYWNKPAATAEVMRDGWLHTGDIGSLEGGYLRITGRKKELLITSGGKNIAPTYLENLLCQDPLISQAMIVGDRQKYLAALIVPDRAQLEQEMARRKVSGDRKPPQDAAQDLMRECVARRLSCVGRCEQVQKFLLLDRPFSIEAGELTPTLKLRRPVIERRFAREIQQLFAE